MVKRMVVLAVLGVGSAALACLWDSDTYSEEALKQKDVAEIVRGQLGKHSDFFYEEKIAYTKPLVDSADAGMTLKDFDGKPDFDRLRKEYEKGQAEMKAAQDEEDALLKAGKRKQVFGY